MIDGISPHPTPASIAPGSDPQPAGLVSSVIAASQSESSGILAELNRFCSSSDSLEKLVRSCKELVCSYKDVSGLWMSQRSNSLFEETFSLIDGSDSKEWDAKVPQFKKLMRQTLNHRRIQTLGNGNDLLIAAPVFDGQQVNALLVGEFRDGNTDVSEIEFILGAVCQTISTWLATQRCLRSEVRIRSLNDVVVLSRALDKCTNLNSAAIVLVNQLKRMTGATQVAFATQRRSSSPNVVAISDLDEIDSGFDGLKAIRLACAQSLETQEIQVFPDRRENKVEVENPLQQYCRDLGHEACICLPLKTDSQTLGCLLIATTPKKLAEQSYTTYLTEVSQMLAGHLNMIIQANRSLFDHALSSVNGRLRLSRSKTIAAVLFSIIALMLIPWPYRVACDCEIQPVSRRFVAAPHDGVLEKNLVEIGDVVEAGQMVAVLDDRQLRIELAGLEAELNGATKRRSAATAKGSIAEAQIASSEARKLTAEIELVKNKLKNLEIASPIPGIVVAGDLEKVQGAPVEMGQTLFEVGPLDNMLVEISVPEDEIAYVKPGMPISIKLNAYPFETWTGSVTRIHPKSEIRNEDTVFIAEVELPNPAHKLKPGMQGRVKIKSFSHPIGWNLFHRPIEKIRYWTVW